MKYKFFLLTFLFVTQSFTKETIILQISIPKCGTHLLMKCINLLTSKNPLRFRDIVYSGRFENLPELSNQHFYFEHFFYNENYINTNIAQIYNLKGFFILRDPRDQLISSMFWINNKSEWFPEFQKLNNRELLFELIKNRTKLYFNYLPWIKEPNYCQISFENLIGPKGGGSLELQINEIKKICKHLELNVNEEKINEVCSNLHGGTASFREGKIGAWRDHFELEHKELFKSLYENLLIDLGYEKDGNW